MADHGKHAHDDHAGHDHTQTGRKGRGLFHPLRRALTARDTGPEMAALLPLIGREAALQRLRP